MAGSQLSRHLPLIGFLKHCAGFDVLSSKSPNARVIILGIINRLNLQIRKRKL